MDVPGYLRSFYNCSALLARAVKVEGMVDELYIESCGGIRWQEGSSLMRWLDDISHWTEILQNLHGETLWRSFFWCGVGSTSEKQAIFLLLWLALLISMLVGWPSYTDAVGKLQVIHFHPAGVIQLAHIGGIKTRRKTYGKFRGDLPIWKCIAWVGVA